MQNAIEQKLQAAIKTLGTRWILHKSNATQRRTPFTATQTELRSRLGA